jgi:hypothetical protein
MHSFHPFQTGWKKAAISSQRKEKAARGSKWQYF